MQITRTMEMVAAAKIRKAQQRIEAARPFALQMMEVLSNVVEGIGSTSHPLLEARDTVKKTVVIALTSDRGLCGAANASILRKSENLAAAERGAGAEVSVFPVGRKGINFFRYLGMDILDERRGISDDPKFSDAREIADEVISLYEKKEIDKVVLIFNHFKSAMEQTPVEHVLLPIKQEVVEGEAVRESAVGYMFEPGDDEVLKDLLPTYVEALIYRALLESAASEHGARRTAMKAATDNASELIEILTRVFNRARQAAITQEIAEIVGGAEAMVEEKVLKGD